MRYVGLIDGVTHREEHHDSLTLFDFQGDKLSYESNLASHARLGSLVSIDGVKVLDADRRLYAPTSRRKSPRPVSMECVYLIDSIVKKSFYLRSIHFLHLMLPYVLTQV